MTADKMTIENYRKNDYRKNCTGKQKKINVGKMTVYKK